MSEAIASYVQSRSEAKPARLLDIGPGSGRSLRFCEAAGIAEQIEFWGIDNSEDRIKNIHQPARWRLTLGNAEQGLPYPSEHFDICLCEQVLEHLAQPSELIREIVRVLRPGGLLIVGVPTFTPGVAQLRRCVVALLDRCFGMKRAHLQTFTCQSFKSLVCNDQPLKMDACRGFRITSGGFLSWLEDHEWWYRLNRWAGRLVPWFCTEVQLVLHKGGGPEPHSRG